MEEPYLVEATGVLERALVLCAMSNRSHPYMVAYLQHPAIGPPLLTAMSNSLIKKTPADRLLNRFLLAFSDLIVQSGNTVLRQVEQSLWSPALLHLADLLKSESDKSRESRIRYLSQLLLAIEDGFEEVIDKERKRRRHTGDLPRGCAAVKCSRRTIGVCEYCQCTRYCSRRCQRRHWSIHKDLCLKTNALGMWRPTQNTHLFLISRTGLEGWNPGTYI